MLVIDPVLLGLTVRVIARLHRRGGAALGPRPHGEPAAAGRRSATSRRRVERAISAIRTVRASNATEREIATPSTRTRSARTSRRPGRQDLRARRADRGIALQVSVPRRARRRRIPGRERRDHDREPGRVHPLPVHDDHAARPGVRRPHLGEPGARRARPHPGDHRPPQRGPSTDRRRSSRAATQLATDAAIAFEDVHFALSRERRHKTEREKAIAEARASRGGGSPLADAATARRHGAARRELRRCRAASARRWSARPAPARARSSR